MTLIRSDDATLVENRRNLALSPFGQGALPGYAKLAAQESIAGAISVGGISAPVALTPNSFERVRLPAGSTAGGGVELTGGLPAGTYVVSMWVNRRAGAATSIGFALRGLRSVGSSRTFTFNTWTYLEETLTIAAGEAGAVLGWRSTVNDAAESEFLFTLMQVALVGQQSAMNERVVEGGRTADGDKSYTWAGAANASPSIEWQTVPAVNIVPLVVEGFEYSRPARSILHPLLGSSDHDVTFRPGGLRAGRMRLVMPDAATARAAEVGLLTPRVFTLTDPDVSELTMRFVVAGEDIGVQLDPVTRRRWIVTVPFQEVL